MDFDDNPSEAAFRAEARKWIAANKPSHLDAELERSVAQAVDIVHLPVLTNFDPLAESRAWQLRKYQAGWACVSWPKQYGCRAGSQMERVIFLQEEGIYAALSHVFQTGQGMCGTTLMAHGSEHLQQKHLRRLASGEDLWCQMFSEPSGGSDLAALKTRAERLPNGDWKINGSKIWTTHAQLADFGLLIARTDPDVPKHKGLSMFVLDLKLPGITVQPIRQMSGAACFNQVFFSDVILSDENRIGDVGAGWKISLTTLMNERLLLGSTPDTGIDALLALCATTKIGSHAAIDDPAVRAKIALWVAQTNGLKFAMMRAISDLSSGRPPGPEYSVGKLMADELLQQVCQFALDLLGPSGVLAGPGHPAAQFVGKLLKSPSVRVGGGTSDIQRNIIAERVLKIPQEPRPDKTVPYSQLAAT